MRRVFIFFLVFLSLTVPLCAQTADNVTKLLESKQVSFDQAAYFASVWIHLIEDYTGEQHAGDLLLEKIPELSVIKRNKPLRYNDLALICMKAWRFKGGISWSAKQNRRNALREMKAWGLIPANADPHTKVNGRETLYIMMKCGELADAKGVNAVKLTRKEKKAAKKAEKKAAKDKKKQKAEENFDYSEEVFDYTDESYNNYEPITSETEQNEAEPSVSEEILYEE